MSDELQLTDDEARIDAILRSMSDEDLELDTPPASVWAGIQAAVAAEEAEAPAEEPAAAEEPLAPVVSLASRRRMPMLLGAVAAALVVIAGLAVVLVSDDPSAVEVASADLVYVEDDPAFVPLGAGSSVDVTLLEDGETETIRVDTAVLPEAGDDGDLEIWLIGIADGEIQIVQTLGLVENPDDPGTFAVPAGFERSAYDAVAVDISIEPHDGDEAHSGMSLVRGLLTA
jgi:hypothetical protein